METVLKGIFARAPAALLLVLAAGTAGADSIYKCTVDGRTVFQSAPCAPGTGGVVELKPLNSLGDRPEAPPPGGGAAGTGKRKSVVVGMPPGYGSREAAPAPAPPAALKPLAGGYDSGNTWFADYDGYRSALRESERSGAPLLVYFYTDWCPVCKRFNTNVLSDTTVRERLRRFVKVRINAERGEREDRFFRESGGKGIPFIIAARPGQRPARVKALSRPEDWVPVLDGLLTARR